MSSFRGRGGVRLGLVVLLVVAGIFAAMPWISCISSIRPRFPALPNFGPMLAPCTFETFQIPNAAGPDVPGFSGPYWGYLLVGLLYVIAAIYIARTKRPL